MELGVMCDYCDTRMYHMASTSEERVRYRLEMFVAECRHQPLGLFRRDCVADVIESILTCEAKDVERESEVREEIRELALECDTAFIVEHELVSRKL